VGGLPLPDDEPRETLFILERGNACVGWAGFVGSQAFAGSDRELICVIAPDFRGTRLASEACTALVAWAFQAKGWPRILACVDAEDHRGLRLASNLGFREVGRRQFDSDVLVLEITG
jgi:RimJ/RimL family protein N-acetyltransferase